ncbi:PREDICTED: cysteine-rich with EGF-like domain protein 2-A isoform X4 [Branchiostoma belcheri]|uniref:Cysteine-rich with EGF-like domain protein 2-A isoform X4 n=1 Tax=Branchiostoma belcheri TaxID=7741 RepID=A0A6P4ZEK2_BRABE|nr:PREDICTED: cysteine-rich with EGF-like domain protein 2-A isoform X4 [Branchiostoma belcheri]
MTRTMRNTVAALSCLLFLLLWHSPAAGLQWNCETCKGITDRFAQKYAETEKGGYGGGNTDWEETYLKEYRRSSHWRRMKKDGTESEVRLLEIIEQLCVKDNHACYALVEEHEELLEEWWQKDESPDINLYKWFCIDHIKVCCPEGQWGPRCIDCPIGREKVCSDHGKCDGDGTREGTGACTCDKGYQGALCEQCTNDHYEEYKNTTHVSCKECNEACEECFGPEANECRKCRENHVLLEGSCEECHELCTGCTGLGPENCVKCKPPADMVDGTCIDCARACHGCTGPGPEHCKRCRMGFKKNKEEVCEDVDECKVMCRLQHEVCTNTIGSYECLCEEGYERNQRELCVMKIEDEDDTEGDSEVATEASKVRLDKKYKRPNKQPRKMLTGTQEAIRLVSIFFIVVLALVVALVEPILGAFVAVVGGVVWYFVMKTF